MIGDDPDLPDREKYMGNPNYVTEYLTAESSDLNITFYEPAKFFDVSRFEEANVGTALCGVVGLMGKPFALGILIHYFQDTSDGCEQRARFGGGLIEGYQDLSIKEILDKVEETKFEDNLALQLQLG